ncbi:unnamed protein product [Thlaspi arvense]|uniref:BAG domain-containing protein n=1 Tax=Thlaspi arvense TaxID=13288 RepID=A0AAU9RWX4_THLAR|nr:unnamed protein product [Thlaspi arvense]
MKRSSSSLKRSNGGVENSGHRNNDVAIIDWELRPGGMLVQKRSGVGSDSGGASSGGPMIKIKVSHGSSHHDITVPAQSTFAFELESSLVFDGYLGSLNSIRFGQSSAYKTKLMLSSCFWFIEGDLKKALARETDLSKVILLEDPASKERKLQEMKRNAYENIARVHLEVDKLSDKSICLQIIVVALEMAVANGGKVANNEFVLLTELFMVQLLKLDSIEADGEAKVQRRAEVRRIQNFVDALDSLKARNSNPFNTGNAPGLVNTKWETFDSVVGSLSPPNPRQFSAKVTKEWELFS